MRAALPNPCLLEAGQLPLQDLAKLAAREGRRPRAVYTGHKWFARRLGTVFRALLVGASSAPDANFWEQYYGEADMRDLVVFDPFVGGGTSVVEATRLGATAHAVDIDLFRKLAEAGHDLLVLHLLESPKLGRPITTYNGPRNPEVGRVGWSDGTVWLDAAKTNARNGQCATKPGTISFQGVPEEVWDFQIGGYQVCHKWLKDRKGRTLSDEEVAHYQKIVVALNETIRIMAEIDEVINHHGGWPDAFQAG